MCVCMSSDWQLPSDAQVRRQVQATGNMNDTWDKRRKIAKDA